MEEKRVPRGSRESSWGARLTPEDCSGERYEPKVYIPPVITAKSGKVFEDQPFKTNPADSVKPVAEATETPEEAEPPASKKETPVWILLVLGAYIIVTSYKQDRGFPTTLGMLTLLYVIWSAFRASDRGSSLWREWIRGKPSNVVILILLPAYITWTVMTGRWSRADTLMAACGFIVFIFMVYGILSVFEEHVRMSDEGESFTTLHAMLLIILWKIIRNWTAFISMTGAFFVMLYLEPELTRRAANEVWNLLWGPMN